MTDLEDSDASDLDRSLNELFERLGDGGDPLLVSAELGRLTGATGISTSELRAHLLTVLGRRMVAPADAEAAGKRFVISDRLAAIIRMLDES